MPSQTNTDRINELAKDVAMLTVRHAILEAEAEARSSEIVTLKAAQQDLKDDLADVKSRLALLAHQVDELRKGKDEFGRRAWAVVGPIVGALVGATAAYLLRR